MGSPNQRLHLADDQLRTSQEPSKTLEQDKYFSRTTANHLPCTYTNTHTSTNT